MKTKRKASSRPPWWCKATLYMAVWPGPEFVEYRLSLQRNYRKRIRKYGVANAKRWASRECAHWLVAVIYRLARLAMFWRLAHK